MIAALSLFYLVPIVSNQSIPKVLIFDSGVGGLSVYREIEMRLPQLSYTYLFDNAAYPYGELDQQVLLQRVERLITGLVEQEGFDIVVIACNTASTIVLPTLRSKLSIPVVGVVPAIKPASSIANKAVGLIATPATVTRQYTHDLIRSFSADKNVELLGSTRLVDMAEEKLRGRAIDLQELQNILSPLISHIDVAVLGCTHFPLIRDEIQQVLGKDVLLVDSGEAIARRVKTLLGIEAGVCSENKHTIYSSAPPWEESALNERLEQLGFSAIRPYPLLGV
ncbi:glutamate racemase [Vibrio diazotrophicus]|jgi:glutamate racemase|uniref:Glutamate racemase n=1 Tax=Vibrio diazotrophicus TaxID=685 RepID=A0A329E5I2_VIBDI|nr:glutamate racemase [Vibrio diazotrophicus]RAS59699.1 glutamate racemase [Vibrio diazotrophicus]